MLRWLPVFAWIVIICYLSFSSLEHLQVPSFSGVDKVGHFGIYFILEILLFWPLNRSLKLFTIATLVAIVFALSTELIQHFWVENRVGDPFDFLANIVGLGIAYLFLRRRIKS